MIKSDCEIAAEVYGSDWAEQADAVRGEWEQFVSAVRKGDLKLRKDARYAAVNRLLGLTGCESVDSTDRADTIGDDAELDAAINEIIASVKVKPAPKKKSLIAKLKGKK